LRWAGHGDKIGMHTKFWSENKGRDSLEDLNIDEKAILKWYFVKWELIA
jgi:hypothetical protein